MKTTKNVAAISLMLLFAVVASFSSNAAGIVNPPVANAMIRHLVLIPSFNERQICGNYVVEIRDEKGQLVAPYKFFVPGTSQYVFYERAFSGEGVRTAIIRPASNNDAQCSLELYAAPVTIKGTFEAGKTYRYILEPKVIGGHKE